MELFKVNFATIVMRFFLMMAVVIIGVFTGQYWLVVLALPIFLSAMLGFSFKATKAEKPIRSMRTNKAGSIAA